MIDLRDHKIINLKGVQCLKEDVTYQIKDEITGKNLIVKFIGYYDDSNDVYLLGEFKKLFLLSAEPEIGTVYYLASSELKGENRNCYVMDFIQGKSIGKVISESDELSFEYILSIVKQLASGLEKSHNHEITHCDLHEENIIIDNLGFLKIIDFAFWGNTIQLQKNIEFDIKCFNEIVKKLFDKCKEYERNRVGMIIQLCKDIKTFKDLSKHIELLEDISFDYNLLDENGKELISLIIKEIPFDVNLSMGLVEKEIDIPQNPLLEQTPEEKMYMEKENSRSGGLKYTDQRLLRINNFLNNLLFKKLHQLKQAGLIDWEAWASNPGEKFIGPYKYNFQISLTPKLLKWKKVNSIIGFLNDVKDKSLIQNLINE